jgi:hypothetical protein
VEGSILDRFLRGDVRLEEVTTYNRILLAVNRPVSTEMRNTVAAAQNTLGADVRIVQLDVPLKMKGWRTKTGARGEVRGHEELVAQVLEYDFDALAIASPIDTTEGTMVEYFKKGGINPWGYVEAKASALIASRINKPVAHAPVENSSPEECLDVFHTQVDPRMAAEVISNTYAQSIFKGLHRAPRLSKAAGLSIADVDALVSPYGCWGTPHKACEAAGIPVILVRENTCCLNETLGAHVQVDNYWEAAGLVQCMRTGVVPHSVRRPVKNPIVCNHAGLK